MYIQCNTLQVMEYALTNETVKSAVLISKKPGCFIAGADIGWLDSTKSKQEVSLAII